MEKGPTHIAISRGKSFHDSSNEVAMKKKALDSR
jgi:hypothetical protein